MLNTENQIRLILIIILCLLSFATVSAKGTNNQYRTKSTGVTVSETASHTVSIRTYFLESKTTGTYKAFVKAFKGGEVVVKEGFMLVGTQFYKTVKEIHELTELRPESTTTINGLTIQHF